MGFFARHTREGAGESTFATAKLKDLLSWQEMGNDDCLAPKTRDCLLERQRRPRNVSRFARNNLDRTSFVSLFAQGLSSLDFLGFIIGRQAVCSALGDQVDKSEVETSQKSLSAEQ